MTDQGGGKIINMSSFIGEAGNIGQANYRGQGRAARLSKTAALELARFGITVNALCPIRDGYGRQHSRGSPAEAKQVPASETGRGRQAAVRSHRKTVTTSLASLSI